MATQIKIYDRDTLLATVREMRPTGAHIGGGLFPVESIGSDSVLYDVVTEVTGGLAEFRALDSEAELIGNDLYEQIKVNTADIANKKRFNVTDFRIFREPGQNLSQRSVVGEMRKTQKTKVNKALRTLRSRVDNRLEQLRMNAILGTVSQTSGKTRFSVDYSIPSGQTGQTPSINWDTVATATPLDDLNAWCDTVEDTSGVRPTRLVLSRTALLQVVKNAGYRDTFKQVGSFISRRKKAVDLIQAETDLEVTVYNGSYSTKSKSNVVSVTKFLDNKKIILLPPYAPGVTLVAPHPLADFESDFYGWEKTKEDPYSQEYGVGIVAFPVLTKAREVFNATVLS